MAADDTPDAIFDAAAAKWPSFRVDRTTFLEAVARSESDDPFFGIDFYLAHACADGDPAALRVFESELVPELRRAIARLRFDEADVSEILQRVRMKVLFGVDAKPKIASYEGRGPLLGWLRAIAVHEAMSAVRVERRRGREITPSVLERSPSAEDPEMSNLRALYGPAFRSAFARTVASLSARERNVLRLSYVEGLTAEQVGIVYGAHRVSVARWLGAIRESLFERTRELLRSELRLSPSEFESLTRLCLSQLDVSLERVLAELSVTA